jgi:hypothetical protein
VTSTVTPTVTNTNTPTQTVTASETPGVTPTSTPTNTVTPSVTSTVTPTVTNTNTPTQTVTASVTQTLTPSNTPTNTPTVTKTSTVTPTLTQSVTPSVTPESTVTPTVTQSVTPTDTPAPTMDFTATPFANSATPTPTLTPTPSPTSVVGSPILLLDGANATSSTWTDTSGGGNDATLYNSPTVSSSNGGIVTFDGTSQYGEVPSGFDNFSNGITILAFVNFNGVSNWERIIDFGNGDESDNIIFGRNGSTNNLWFEIRQGATQAFTQTITNGITNNGWGFYVGRLDGSTYTMFNQTTSVSGLTSVLPNVITRNNNYIGDSNWAADDFFDGDMGIVALYDSAISDSDITSFYDQYRQRYSLSPLPYVTPTPTVTASNTPTPTTTPTYTPTASVTPTPTPSAASLLSCYVAGPLTADTSNGAVFDRSINVSGMLEVIAGAVGGNVAVPDEFSKKVARSFQLIMDPSATGITLSYQNNLVATLRGDVGTIHEGIPTAQRVGYGSGDDYDPNWLTDEGITGYTGYQEFLDTHATNDMVWYSSGSTSGDTVIGEVFEHIFHTVHLFGIMGAVPGSSTAVNWMAEQNPNWQTTDLHLAMKQAIDNSMFDPSEYAPNWSGDTEQAQLAYKEYMYLLNWSMWEMSEFWAGGSLSPEWNDNMRTPSGIQTNNILGYNLFNSYFAPVLTKPSFVTLRNIFQDNHGGVSGYFADDCITPTPTPTQTPQVTSTPTPSVTSSVTPSITPTQTVTPSGTSPIVSNLLVYLDARNSNSYLGTGTLWTDLQGNYNGTLVNGPTYNSTDKSIVTDGIDDYILLSNVAGTGNATQSFTYELWINPDDTNGNIMSMSESNPQTGWNMPPIAAEDGRFRGKIWQNNYLYSTSPFNQGQWYQVVLVWDFSSGTQSLYINGVLNDSEAGVSYLSSGVDNNIFFGQQNPGADNTGDFRGEYGIIRLYNTALTSSQILNNFNTTTPYP